MHLPLSNRTVLGILAALTVFGALSAFVGAALAVAANGAGVPLEYLAHSPFSSYVVPGLFLGVIVGGTQLAAAVTLITKRRSALLLSAVAGFGMLIWIFVELAVIKQYSWLQTAFFMFDFLELILVLALFGVVPTLVYPLRMPDERDSVVSAIHG